MKKPVIVDTNVLVSALVSPNRQTPPGRIVRHMLAGKLVFVLSANLLAEYRTVLSRPHLRQAHGLAPEDVEALLVELTLHAIVLHPVAAAPAPDPGDQHLWELLAAREDLMLVTGDKRLLDSDKANRILSPKAFVADWQGEIVID
jgi:putative PIN family toxin of toxin-antitoxin system